MDDIFSQRLTELIKSGNYTLDHIADVVGKRAATISRYASGEIKGVKRSTISSIANLYGVSASWLAGLSDEKYDNTHQTSVRIGSNKMHLDKQDMILISFLVALAICVVIISMYL